MLAYHKYQIAQIKQTGIIIRKNIIITKKSKSKYFYFQISYTDIFDCPFKEFEYKIRFPPLQRKFLERLLKKDRKVPLELFSTKEHPLTEYEI